MCKGPRSGPFAHRPPEPPLAYFYAAALAWNPTAVDILAYQRLVEDGLPADAIASRFGQSVVTVRQRLKLASLSPAILDEMRSDAITIEQARALAISDDHGAQEAAWFGREGWSRCQAPRQTAPLTP